MERFAQMAPIVGMDVQALVGQNLNRIRMERGLSQEALALRCELISQGYISKLEDGKRNPTSVILYILAAALEVDVGALFSKEGMPLELIEGPILIRSKRSKKTSIDIF